MKVVNRKARFNYQILETLEAGIDLFGFEVHSVRKGSVILDDAFVNIRSTEAFLVNAHIHPYQNSQEKISPTRTRKLLLHKKEIVSLEGKIKTNGLTVVPTAIYNKGNIFKVELGIARGKKKWDKRDDLKKKAQNREIEIALRNKV